MADIADIVQPADAEKIGSIALESDRWPAHPDVLDVERPGVLISSLAATWETLTSGPYLQVLGRKGLFVNVHDNKMKQNEDGTFCQTIVETRSFGIPISDDGKRVVPGERASINDVCLKAGITNVDQQHDAWPDEGAKLNTIVLWRREKNDFKGLERVQEAIQKRQELPDFWVGGSGIGPEN